MSVSQVLSLIAVATGLYASTLFTYRLFFHSLARIPGPVLAAVTFWWEVYQDWFSQGGGQFFRRLEHLHKTYGAIVRITPNEVHVDDPSFVDVLFTGPSHERNRDPAIAGVAGTSQGTFGAVSHTVHRRRRAAIGLAFSKRAVYDMEGVILTNSKNLWKSIERWGSGGEVLDLRAVYLAWSADIITGLIFDNAMGMLEDYEKAVLWHQDFAAFDKYFALFKQFPSLVRFALSTPLTLARILHPQLIPFLSLYKKMHTVASLKENESKSCGGTFQSHSIYNTILTSRLANEEKSASRMGDEAFEILGAGSLTTAKVATSITFHVLNDAAVLQRLRRELTQMLPPSDQLPSLKLLGNLPYLNAVLQEGLRIALPITSRSALICPYDNLRYQGWHIPAGVILSMTFSSLALDSRYVEEPYSFKPDRWLDESNGSHGLKRAVLPFGQGSRMCLGSELALAELLTGIAAVFRNLDLELYATNRASDVDHNWGGFIGQPSPFSSDVRVQVRKRL